MIFYLIGSYHKSNPGLGGHYYSLMHIAQEISNKKEVAIVNIGSKKSIALKEWEGRQFFIRTSLLNTRKAVNILNNLCQQYRPDILHAFDPGSAYFARRASIACKIPWVITKCGGPTPKERKHFLSPSGYYPKATVQTVFHKNDFEWFKNRRSKPSFLELIPARVKVEFSQRPELNELNDFYANSEIRLIRIARVSELHFSSLLQSVKFTQKMCERGIKAKLALIGFVNSAELYRKLKFHRNSLRFFTRPSATVRPQKIFGGVVVPCSKRH